MSSSSSNEEDNTNELNDTELLSNVLNVANDLSRTTANATDNDTDNINPSRHSNIPSESSSSSLGILDSISQTSFRSTYSNELLDLSSVNANDANTARYSNIPSESSSSSLGILDSISQTSFRSTYSNELPDLSSVNANDANTARLSSSQTNFLPNDEKLNQALPKTSSDQLLNTNNFPNTTSTLSSPSLGIFEECNLDLPESNYNPNNTNAVDILLPTNNCRITCRENIADLPVTSAYDENRQFSSHFIKHRNNIINTLINEGKIRICNPRNTNTTENNEQLRQTGDDLLNNDDVADFNIGGVPVQWIGLDNLEFSANVDPSTSLQNLHNFQIAEIEEWSRRLNVVREASEATLRWASTRLEELYAENTALLRNLNQEPEDRILPEWIRINENTLPSMNSNNSQNEPSQESVLNRRLGISNSDSDDDTLIEETTTPSSSFLPWNFNRLSMLVEASDSTLSTVLANLTNRENEVDESSRQPRQTSCSSPLPWSHVSIENYFSDIQDLDIETSEEDTNNSSRQISEEDSMNRRINVFELCSSCSSLNLDDPHSEFQAPPSSNMQDISIEAQSNDNSINVNDSFENSTSHTLSGSLEESMGASASPSFSDSLEDATTSTTSDSFSDSVGNSTHLSISLSFSDSLEDSVISSEFYDSLEDVTIPLQFSLENSDLLSEENEQTNSVDTEESQEDESTRDLSAQ